MTKLSAEVFQFLAHSDGFEAHVTAVFKVTLESLEMQRATGEKSRSGSECWLDSVLVR